MQKFSRILFLAVLAFIVFSCDDSENEVPDTSGPDITDVTPAENKKVKGTLTIGAKAEDLSNEVTMEILIDNTQIKKEVTKEITAQTNTKLLTEGTHTVKIVATDKDGNATTKEFSIEVRNVLFKLFITPGYIGQYETVYCALSRNDGSLIAFGKAENNTTFSVETPEDFNLDSTFVYNQYFYSYTPPATPQSMAYRINNVNTYGGLSPGEFKLPQAEIPQAKVGSHNLQISDVPASLFVFLGGQYTNYYSYIKPNDGVNQDVSLYSTPSDLMCVAFNQQEDSAPMFKYLSTIRTGESTKLSFDDFTAMNKGTVKFNSAIGDYTIYAYSEKDNSLYFRQYFTTNGNTADQQLILYYPGNSFAKYIFEIYADVYRNVTSGPTPPATFQYLNAELKNVSYSNRKLKFTTVGDFDLAGVGFSRALYTDTSFELDAYSVNFPAGNSHKIVLPEIPLALVEYKFIPVDQLTFTYGSVVDYSDLSADKYAQSIVFSDHGRYPGWLNQVSKRFSFSSTGGRLSSERKVPQAVRLILTKHAPGFTY